MSHERERVWKVLRRAFVDEINDELVVSEAAFATNVHLLEYLQ